MGGVICRNGCGGAWRWCFGDRVALAGKVIEAGNDGEIPVAPAALETRHGDACEGACCGELDVFFLSHREADLDILEHVLERKAGVEVSSKHAGELEVDHAGAGGVILKSEGEFVEFYAVSVEQGECLCEGCDGVCRDEVGGDFDDRGLADATDFQNLLRRGFELRTHALEGLRVAADVVNKLTCGSSIPAASEGGIEKGGVFFPNDSCGGECVGGGDRGVV